jgi:hypothetical protein
MITITALDLDGRVLDVVDQLHDIITGSEIRCPGG